MAASGSQRNISQIPAGAISVNTPGTGLPAQVYQNPLAMGSFPQQIPAWNYAQPTPGNASSWSPAMPQVNRSGLPDDPHFNLQYSSGQPLDTTDSLEALFPGMSSQVHQQPSSATNRYPVAAPSAATMYAQQYGMPSQAWSNNNYQRLMYNTRPQQFLQGTHRSAPNMTPQQQLFQTPANISRHSAEAPQLSGLGIHSHGRSSELYAPRPQRQFPIQPVVGLISPQVGQQHFNQRSLPNVGTYLPQVRNDLQYSRQRQHQMEQQRGRPQLQNFQEQGVQQGPHVQTSYDQQALAPVRSHVNRSLITNPYISHNTSAPNFDTYSSNILNSDINNSGIDNSGIDNSGIDNSGIDNFDINDFDINNFVIPDFDVNNFDFDDFDINNFSVNNSDTNNLNFDTSVLDIPGTNYAHPSSSSTVLTGTMAQQATRPPLTVPGVGMPGPSSSGKSVKTTNIVAPIATSKDNMTAPQVATTTLRKSRNGVLLDSKPGDTLYLSRSKGIIRRTGANSPMSTKLPSSTSDDESAESAPSVPNAQPARQSAHQTARNQTSVTIDLTDDSPADSGEVRHAGHAMVQDRNNTPHITPARPGPPDVLAKQSVADDAGLFNAPLYAPVSSIHHSPNLHSPGPASSSSRPAAAQHSSQQGSQHQVSTPTPRRSTQSQSEKPEPPFMARSSVERPTPPQASKQTHLEKPEPSSMAKFSVNAPPTPQSSSMGNSTSSPSQRTMHHPRPTIHYPAPQGRPAPWEKWEGTEVPTSKSVPPTPTQPPISTRPYPNTPSIGHRAPMQNGPQPTRPANAAPTYHPQVPIQPQVNRGKPPPSYQRPTGPFRQSPKVHIQPATSPPPSSYQRPSGPLRQPPKVHVQPATPPHPQGTKRAREPDPPPPAKLSANEQIAQAAKRARLDGQLFKEEWAFLPTTHEPEFHFGATEADCLTCAVSQITDREVRQARHARFAC